MNVYGYSAETINGEIKSLADYKGKVVLIVNTASECGFTPQLEGLQNLYEEYKNQDFEIFGFPCNQFGNQDPGSNNEIEDFCQLKYGVSFPMFAKVDVNGDDAHPLFQYLTNDTGGAFAGEIKWNFTKFLINKDGDIVARFTSQKKPEELNEAIEKELVSVRP